MKRSHLITQHKKDVKQLTAGQKNLRFRKSRLLLLKPYFRKGDWALCSSNSTQFPDIPNIS